MSMDQSSGCFWPHLAFWYCGRGPYRVSDIVNIKSPLGARITETCQSRQVRPSLEDDFEEECA